MQHERGRSNVRSWPGCYSIASDCPCRGAVSLGEHGMNNGGKNDGKAAGRVLTITRGASWSVYTEPCDFFWDLINLLGYPGITFV